MRKTIIYTLASVVLLSGIGAHAGPFDTIVNTVTSGGQTVQTVVSLPPLDPKTVVLKSFGDLIDTDYTMPLKSTMQKRGYPAPFLVIDTKPYAGTCFYVTVDADYDPTKTNTYHMSSTGDGCNKGDLSQRTGVVSWTGSNLTKVSFSIKVGTAADTATTPTISGDTSSCKDGHSIMAIEQTGQTAVNVRCYKMPLCADKNYSTLPPGTVPGMITASGNKYCDG